MLTNIFREYFVFCKNINEHRDLVGIFQRWRTQEDVSACTRGCTQSAEEPLHVSTQLDRALDTWLLLRQWQRGTMIVASGSEVSSSLHTCIEKYLIREKYLVHQLHHGPTAAEITSSP